MISTDFHLVVVVKAVVGAVRFNGSGDIKMFIFVLDKFTFLIATSVSAINQIKLIIKLRFITGRHIHVYRHICKTPPKIFTREFDLHARIIT